jgi:streptogramin lyase
VTPDGLLGTWSVDARYAPGAMEDWLLHFRADGRGCLWYGNLMGAHVAVTVGVEPNPARRQLRVLRLPPGPPRRCAPH